MSDSPRQKYRFRQNFAFFETCERKFVKFGDLDPHIQGDQDVSLRNSSVFQKEKKLKIWIHEKIASFFGARTYRQTRDVLFKFLVLCQKCPCYNVDLYHFQPYNVKSTLYIVKFNNLTLKG